MPIRRQLAPTVRHKASDVTFQVGTLGGIGETIAVGRAMRYGNNHYISCDESYIPADDYVVGCGVVPFGGVDVFIGYTSEAYGLPRISIRHPTRPTIRKSTHKTDLSLPPLRSQQTQIYTLSA